MIDGTKPSVELSGFRRSGTIDSQLPNLKIKIKDKGSGISKWNVTFAGEWLLMAYDPEQDILIWERDKPLEPGEGDLVITVEDEAGNTTEKTISFTVPGQ